MTGERPHRLDLELYFPGEVIPQRVRVHEPGRPADEKDATLAAADVDLVGADAVPDDSAAVLGPAAGDGEARLLVAVVEALGGLPLEEHHLGRACLVAPPNFGPVDVRGVHATDVADGAQQAGGREVRRQTRDEEAAVLVRDDGGRSVAVQGRIAAVVGREAPEQELDGFAFCHPSMGARLHGTEDAVLVLLLTLALLGVGISDVPVMLRLRLLI